ncbi:hypothetical protein X566_03205 [Afipia sp. P52-10]|jgi:AcrR family transcriptional regulator|uniref:TetR/AcrR family transcriptional regulator n=1 Tax=Afipia sp. P52-10 TaxID=1429916 RepID=UPI0003DF04CB|nr:TetR/AcrR family transcriptional regulator [Afipia sp. P52-10]ETR78939.1 hypothetical protein X566_03205 [Afipia sp. P52-10]
MAGKGRSQTAPARTRKARGLGYERPDEILAAAKDMFLHEGYHAVTTRRLAERVGLSQAGLYVYFKSKDEILDALCQKTYEATLQRYREIDETYDDDLDRLRAIIRSDIEAGLDHPDEYQIIYMTRRSLLHGKDIQRPFEQQSRGVQVVMWQSRLVERLIKRGVFRRMSLKVASQIVLAMPHGLTAKLIAWPDFPWADRKTLIAATTETLIAGLLAPGASGKTIRKAG